MFLWTCFLLLDIFLHICMYSRLWLLCEVVGNNSIVSADKEQIYRGLICYFIRNLFISTNWETLDKQTTNSISLLCTRDLSWVLTLNLNELLVPLIVLHDLLLGVDPGHVQLAPAAAQADRQHLLAHRRPVTIGRGPGGSKTGDVVSVPCVHLSV